MIVIQPLNLLVRNERVTQTKLFGRVVNGAWDLEINEKEILAKDGRFIVSRRPLIDYKIIPVDLKDQNKDYNEILTMRKYQ